MYCFVDWRSTPSGKEPILPEVNGFLLLAEPGRDSSWGLFDVDFVEDEPQAKGVEPVPEELDALLGSAEGYPPALALARDEIEKKTKAKLHCRDEFARSYSELLRKHMTAQPTSRYVLAEVATGQLGYKHEGEFSWVIGFIPEQNLVKWVSWDYCVYTDPASDFRLLPKQRGELPRCVPTPEPPGLT
jgi:hypothetical protein